jgi:hypothetical protein
MPNLKQCSPKTKKAQPAKPAALDYSSETKVHIASMFDKRAPRMAQLIDAALDAIAISFEATRSVVIDKAVVNGGPDHYARLTGAKRLLEFTLAGRPQPEKEKQVHGPITIQVIEAAIAANREEERLANEGARR